MWRSTALVATFVAAAGCATLENLRQIVQPPRFEEARDQPAEIRLMGPAAGRPIGGATIRLWTRVTNPNPFGLTLSTLDGTLYLEGSRAAAASFPLGLPLEARDEAVVPLEIAVSFADLPGLADVVSRAAGRRPVEYALEGTVGVTAGRLGQQVFGPMTLVRGELRAPSR